MSLRKRTAASQVHYVLKCVTASGGVGYFSGGDYDDDIRKAVLFPTPKSGEECFKALPSKLRPRTWEFSIVKKVVAKRGRNPVPPSSKVRQREAASALFSEFTGHDAEFMEEVEVPNIGVGLKFGMMDGVLYSTIRDGIKESYIHEFSKKSRPTLIAKHDGSQVQMIGGSYEFYGKWHSR